jgi:hypothetical protein
MAGVRFHVPSTHVRTRSDLVRSVLTSKAEGSYCLAFPQTDPLTGRPTRSEGGEKTLFDPQSCQGRPKVVM